MTTLDADRITVSVDGHHLVADVALAAPEGSFVGLLGPNGSGKSTLLRTVARVLRPDSGAVLVGGEDVWSLSARQASLRTAVLAQDVTSDLPFTAREVVELGRVPHQRLLGFGDEAGRTAVEEAMGRTRTAHLGARRFTTLSGGEKQRVLLARSLAQEPKLLLLDEPTNHLDIAAQFELLDLVASLGLTVVAALHDLNAAATYCDLLVVLADGRVVASGTVDEVLTDEVLTAVYGVRASFLTHPITGHRLVALASANHTQEDLR